VSLAPFDRVVAEHGAVVLRVCRALLGPHDAEDAWSETFLAALASYPRLDPTSNVRGWLVTIAHHKAVDRLRAAARHAVPVPAVPDRPVPDPEPPDDGLWALVRALPPKQRGAVVHHHVTGLPYAEVGVLLGTSEAAARRSAADGIKSLRAALAAETEQA